MGSGERRQRDQRREESKMMRRREWDQKGEEKVIRIRKIVG